MNFASVNAIALGVIFSDSIAKGKEALDGIWRSGAVVVRSRHHDWSFGPWSAGMVKEAAANEAP